MTHADKCLLQAQCSAAGSVSCSRLCTSYIAMHGLNGAGGRSAAANVPSAYRSVTLATSKARISQPEIHVLADRYASTFGRQFGPDADGNTQIKSLYLYSSEPGTGKTTTAVALLNAYLIAHYIGSIKRGQAPVERPAYFLDVTEWQADYNAFNRPRVPEEVAAPAAVRFYAAQRIAATVPFLVMDEIGVRDATDAFRTDLHTVINGRVSNELPTVYTSNITLKETVALFDKRVADRMRDQCGELTYKGESKRGMR
ncbi:DNA replication protein [Paenibacillus sp. BIHB 4019]|uniref:DNA replication protein n=1 Tax=Paenibacillus sp. BIHB 4019 TaxID=1870819 RepID=A0A1B2DST0_9BACL|nr:DNA replication protein [Paenibacillus sp. BIHB 4019]ANY70756.1 DNA replication protein [Paenibacillus sp. BIHB 4019]